LLHRVRSQATDDLKYIRRRSWDEKRENKKYSVKGTMKCTTAGPGENR